jgi:hypothetical protein
VPGRFVRLRDGWVMGAVEVLGFPLSRLSPWEREDPRRRYGPIWKRLPVRVFVYLPPPGAPGGGDGLSDALVAIGRSFLAWPRRVLGRGGDALTVRHRFRLLVPAPDAPTLRARLDLVAGELRRSGLDVRPIEGGALHRLVEGIDWTDRHRSPDQAHEEVVTVARRPAGPAGPAEVVRALPPAEQRPRLPAGPS